MSQSKAKRGQIMVICAPSGTGKSTLINRLKEQRPQLVWSVSCTTRAARNGEIHGKDYFFTAVNEFERMIANNEFVEWAKVHSNYYGTSRLFIDDGLTQGKAMLFDLDVQGADNMKRIYGAEANVIFIQPPSLEELERRLRARATDSAAVIEERIRNARSELARSKDYDFLVTNDNLEVAFAELLKIVDKIIG